MADSWDKAVAAANTAIRILRTKPEYRDEPYIDEGNMPDNWAELNRKLKAVFAAAYGRKKKMTVDKSKIRAELVRLKTDADDPYSILEPLYRENIEGILNAMESCDFKKVLEDFPEIDLTKKLILGRQSYSQKPHIHSRMLKIENMLIDTLVEIANTNCKCQFKEE